MVALTPLDDGGKLGTILFQFPPWLMPNRANRPYIQDMKQRLGRRRMTVEFRNNLWVSDDNRDDTLAFLAEHEVPYVTVDEPQGFLSSVPPVVAATGPVSVIRFHGHNAGTWAKKNVTAAERFNYLYSQEELLDWAPKVKQLAEETEEVHVLFNNCHEDKAVRNATSMMAMLAIQA